MAHGADGAAGFGARLRALRVAAGLSQEALAERAGLSVRGISDLERGARRAPRYDTRRRLAEALDLAGSDRALLAADARAPDSGAAPVPAAGAGPGAPPGPGPEPPGAAGALPAGTVTFLFADLEDSTRLLEAHPDAYREAVARHHAVLRGAVEGHGGVVFATVGDAVYAAFARPADAVSAALAGQRALQDEDWGGLGAGAVSARLALHSGAVEVQGGRYLGPALHRTGRLLPAVHGGQVVLTDATAALVRDALPGEAGLRDLGEHRLKDRSGRERVFQLLHPGLRADFPPPATLDAPHHNLPVQLTSFVGRERELAEVARRLGTARLLTLTGPGGAGKTRLALQAAADALEAFPGGVWLTELAPLADPALVSQAVAAAVGVREEPGRPLLATLTDTLAPKRLLLVLDNCEHLLDACARLADALLRGCPRVAILATSREALGIGGEVPWPVPSLALAPPPEAGRCPPADRVARAEAVRLFVERATAVQPRFALTDRNANVVAELCQRLDGLPLAIELAAARLRALPVDHLLARLDDRFRLLTGGSRTALHRHQTLQATVAWSYHLLATEERRVFDRLSVFAGGWTAAAAEVVCAGDGESPGEVLDLMLRLVDKSLVVPDAAATEDGRYRSLETLRLYGQQQLRRRGEVAAVRRRHAAYYAALAGAAAPAPQGPRLAQWLATLDAEQDNVRAALAWSCEDPVGLDLGLRLAGGLWLFWAVRGLAGEGSRWLARLLDLAEHAVPPPLPRARALALTVAGHLAWHRNDLQTASTLTEAGLAVQRGLDDRTWMGLSLYNLGRVALEAGDLARAQALNEELLALQQAAGSPWFLAWALLSLGHVARERGDVAATRARYQESLGAAQWLDDRWTTGIVLAHLGALATAEEDYPTAQEFLGESVRLLREHGDNVQIVLPLEGLARLAAARGQTRRALRLAGASAALRKALGTPLSPSEQATFTGAMRAARQTLSPSATAAFETEGSGMSLEQAVAFALEAPAPDAVRRGG